MVSVSIIGSVARHTGDKLSDRDLLVVGNLADVEPVVRPYMRDGWNVSHFSNDEFEEMARSKALFVQHVKQDGRLVRDDLDHLQAILDGYRMKHDYRQELKAAILPITSIGEPEENYWGLLFQADILYVAIRNSCILYRASISNPDFEFRRLVHWAGAVVGLTRDEVGSLLRLRHFKFAYRNRIADLDISEVSSSIAASKKLAIGLIKFSGSCDVDSVSSNGYFDLRILERRLITSVGPIYMDSLECQHALSEMWAVICNPSIYKKPRLDCLPTWSNAVSAFLSEPFSH